MFENIRYYLERTRLEMLLNMKYQDMHGGLSIKLNWNITWEIL